MSSSKYAEETGSKSSEAAEAPRTPDGRRRSTAEVEAAALLLMEEELDDLNLYEDDDEEEEEDSSSSRVSLDGLLSSPLSGAGASSPLAINLVGMSKTQDVETMLPFPTLAAREEEDAMGGNVSVVFSFFHAATERVESITQNFGIGQTIQMLKGWLEKVCFLSFFFFLLLLSAFFFFGVWTLVWVCGVDSVVFGFGVFFLCLFF